MTRRRAERRVSITAWACFLAFVLIQYGGVWAFVPDDLDFVQPGDEKKISGPVPGRTGPVYVVPSINFRMVYIPPGTFTMGSPVSEKDRDSDETQHQVTLTKGFYMGVTEVTQGHWKKVMGNNPSYFKNCGDDCPVESVSWNDVQEFIRKLNAMEKTDKYRLPTEAEWEYACRAGNTGAYAGDLDSMAWYGNNSGSKTHPVGQKKPNAWGLYDMHGNVCEWCEDCYGNYPSGAVTDPKGPSSGSGRVIRGGRWNRYARYCRSAYRDRSDPGYGFVNYGFRLARTVD